MSEVFISYARSTEAAAQRVEAELRALGYKVWRDEELPAHRAYTDVIEERLRSSKAVLVLWSADAVKSQWVRAEAEVARESQTLVQLSLDGAVPPLPFNQIQCADLRGWTEDPDASGWQKVVGSVAALVGRTPKRPRRPAAPAPAAPIGPEPRKRRRFIRSPVVWAGIAVGLILVAGALIATRLFAPSPNDSALATPVVEVQALAAIGGDPALRQFAGRVSDSIAGFLGDSDVRVVSDTERAKAQLAFGGAVSSADGQLRVRLTLIDKRSGTNLWSHDYVEPSARADALIDQAKGGAMEATNLLRPSFGPSGLMASSESLLLGMRGGEEAILPTAASREDAVHDTEQALALDPDSGILHAAYASDLAGAGLMAAPAEQADLFKHARAEAERTIRDYPRQSGLAYWTLLVIGHAEAPRDWVGGQAQLDLALKAAPEDPFLYGYACGFLQAVGRASDSLYYCQRTLALRPHTAPFLLQYAWSLDMAGDPDHADALLAEGARLYPAFDELRYYRLDREAYNGSADKTLALLHDPAVTPVGVSWAAAWELLQKARKSGLKSDGDAAMAALRAEDQHKRLDAWRVLFPMALGRLDDAFAAPDISVFEVEHVGYLTYKATDRLRRDPRFWPIAARAGLVRYWLTTNKWPDFCNDPTYPLDCRTEAKRVVALSPAPS